ncbi:hypothetical protein BDV93DRAFT_498019 [Ceratobasidium sp. AG-I]|nr:hypothetical protein BDV93DRAFT_498019 [Ceratobasidium sp. AG-I]
MPKHQKQSTEAHDFTFVDELPRKTYRCTVCPTVSQVMSLPHMQKHVGGRHHRKHVAHRQLHDLDLNLPERSEPEPSTTGVADGVGIHPLELMDWHIDALSESAGRDSILDSSDEVLSSASSAALPTPPLPPPPPPPPGSYPVIPEYNFFHDLVYESLEDITGGIAEGLPGVHDSTERAAFASTPLSSRKPKYPPSPNNIWRPFPDKAHFLTYSLFNSAHIRFSRAQQEAILDWAREMGDTEIPTLNSLESCRDEMKEVSGAGPRMYKTTSGHIYYVNSIDDMIKQDFSNPHLRKHLRFYPSDGRGSCTEFWDAQKLSQGENLAQLTPMASNNGISYFVDEVCRLEDGSLFIPEMFFQRQDQIWARGHEVATELSPEYYIMAEKVERPLSSFGENCIQLRQTYPNDIVITSDSKVYTLATHKTREKAGGRHVYSVPFVLFTDDVSGNISKQWNKHWCSYMSNASLPRTEMNKRANIRFMCTTQHAAPLEMLHGICESFKEAFEDLVLAYDIEQQCEVLVRPYILVVTGDNPMQAAECSSTGLNSNHFCRTCHIGGTMKHKSSDEGFAEFFTPGVPRSATETISIINQQYEAAFTSTNADTVTSLQRQTGIKDSIAQPLIDRIIEQRRRLKKAGHPMSEISNMLRAAFLELNPSPKMNPLLLYPHLDVHIDTPTETLHTILLGVVKYLWGQSVFVMDKSKSFDTFTARLRSISADGLATDPVPNYIFTNRGSLNGKHLKLLVQIIMFGLYDLVSLELYNCWRSVGRLTVLLWYSTIHDVDAYTAELVVAIDDFLHSLAKCSPRLIADKGKTHLLVHMPLFVARFGPLVGCNTERYESFNSTFRQCSILSNRHAPSRDIARSFHLFDQTKHIVLGGFYYDSMSRKFMQAGEGVLELGRYSRFTSRILGIPQSEKCPQPGKPCFRSLNQL